MNTPLKPPQFEVVKTRAGHHAVLDHDTGEVMHPVVSPQQEAQQLYLGPARLLERLLQGGPELCLLDVGLGAGSNACAAITAASHLYANPKVRARPLQIVSFDRTAEALALASAPSHAAAFGFDPQLCTLIRRLLNEGETPFPGGYWRLQLGELPTSLTPLPKGLPPADVVFWDPFSPRRNRDLWSLAAFQAVHRVCGPGTTLHTYSGATATRSALLLAGFYVGLGPMLGGSKRATTAATQQALLDTPLPPEFLGRLGRSSAPFPSDAAAAALQQLAGHPQFATRSVV